MLRACTSDVRIVSGDLPPFFRLVVLVRARARAREFHLKLSSRRRFNHRTI